METEWRADTGRLSLFRRALSTLLLARRVHVGVRTLERDLEENPEPDEDTKDARWEELHRANAKATYAHIIKYKGFLAKVGQGLSARDGGIPQPYREEMRALQDHLPISPQKEVQGVVRADLGRPLADIFQEFDFKPLASATVGQAHRAVVRSTGQKVCVKVQHKGVAQMMNVDLRCVEYIAKQALKRHKEVPDVTPVIREWRRASREEVDFTLEAHSARRAVAALEAKGIDVAVPRPVDGLCGRKVLTMDFIEGWKITEVHRMPPGTDVAALARNLLEAFAVLTFHEGLIHGDPHPGNIFAEVAPDGHVRPVLLDWGITKELTADERLNTARWVIASMSHDRNLFMTAGNALGYKTTEHFETDALEDWMTGSMFLFRDSLPSSAQTYLFGVLGQQGEEARKREKEEEQKRLREEEEEKVKLKGKKGTGGCVLCGASPKKKEPKKALESIPGVLLFLTRALSMLQGLCSSLNVTISFAEPMLRHALSLVAGKSVPTLARSISSQGGFSLHAAVLSKLEALQRSRGMVGAQIAVLRDTEVQDTWACNVAFGNAGLSADGVLDGTLMPLLDVSNVVLIACLFVALERPSSVGAWVGLDTPVWQVWPEFAQHGKQGVTIRQLLEHTALLARPFPRKKMNAKRFCNEKRMEETMALAPQDTDCANLACPLLGVAAAALLRRVTGHRTTAEAVRATLEPLDLHRDIAFSLPPEDEARMAWVIRKPIEGLPLPKLFEYLETHKNKAMEKRDGVEPPEWLSWHELEGCCPASTDPLLPNRPELRDGSACAAGRGLRASARALCQLLRRGAGASEAAVARGRKLQVLSMEEWEHSGRCLEVGIGWQLFKFRRLAAKAGAKDAFVMGHGHVDGATGSMAVRLPGISIAILLNGVPSLDADVQHVGFDLMGIVAQHLGLEPVWHLDVPPVPARAPRRQGKVDEELDLRSTLRRLEQNLEQMAQNMQSLSQGFPSAGGMAAGDAPLSGDQARSLDLLGCWQSAEVEGLEALLDLFKVPEALHFLAKQAKRTLLVEGGLGAQLSLSSTTTMAGRTVEESMLVFEPGTPFQGQQQLGGAFTGCARWASSAGGEHALVLEKRFTLDGRELVVEETFAVGLDGRLEVAAACRGLQLPDGERVAEPCECVTTFDRQGPKPGASSRGPAFVRSSSSSNGGVPRLRGQGSGTRWKERSTSRFRQFSDAVLALATALPFCMASCKASSCAGRRVAARKEAPQQSADSLLKPPPAG
mmetsp:Transcript_28692/g.95244  ORF Transcript_28692/g.95244 Transcript_28692/m.95244 type:complete len:1236 (-) Transcript_28692:24-3731(-)